MSDEATNIEAVFSAALELADAAERAAYLAQACGDDAALRGRVEALLKAHSKAGGFLQEPAPGPDGKLPGASEVGEGPGSRIGRYKLLQLIGEGGFGSVYMAEQEEPVRRRVALKIVKLGMDTRQVIGRFEAERQALAMMEHANIANVLDAGATETGRPYFVMELVKGIPITEYCDKNSLTTLERIRLFMPVCQAVQHAHQKGIIHRDIKPSNVMVTLHDGTPVPKVIDFGIAKATHHRLTEKTVFTEFRQFIGTPEYMSPEQAEMSGLDIDTRSDIYSLGVLLYELLAGTTPFDMKALRKAAYGEIQRIIREEEPEKPSTRFSSLGPASATIARNHQSDPSSLKRELRGDLDWITMKCLQKDRTRRYSAATDLAADLHRHLANEPVVAGPPGATYRVGKFVRRNRGLVVGSTTVFFILVAAAVVSAWFAIQATQAKQLAVARLGEVEQAKLQTETERDRALEAERDAETQRAEAERQAAIAMRAKREAQRQAAAAEAVAGFLNEDLLAAVDPRNARGREVTVREVVAKASEAINGRFANEPLVEASTRTTLGEVCLHLGEYERAETHLKRAFDLRNREQGEEHPETIVSMNDLAVLYQTRGRYDEAEALQVRCLELSRRILGEEHPQTLVMMNALALLYKKQGRHDEAEPLYKRTLELRRRVFGEEHPNTLIAMNNLAVLYKHQGRYDEAEALYVETLDLRRRVLGEDHPNTILSMNNLAVLYRRRGRYNEAEPLLSRAMELSRRVLGDEHPGTINLMNNTANLHAQLGRHEEAEPIYRRVLELRRRLLGEEHSSTLGTMNALAGTCHGLGRVDEAEAIYVKVLELRRRVLGEEHPQTLSSINNLAVFYAKEGRLDEAEPLYAAALESYRRISGEEHPDTLKCMKNLARLYRMQGRDSEAEPLYARGLDGRRRVLGGKHGDTLDSMNDLATLYLEQGRLTKAEALAMEAVADARGSFPDGDQRVGEYLGTHGRILTHLEQYGDAERALLESHSLLHAALGATDALTVETIRSLARLYKAWGKPDSAAQWQAKLPTTKPAKSDTEE